MSKPVQIAANAIIAKLYNAPREVKLHVQQLLSYRVEGAEHMAAFKNRSWDGRSSFFDMRAGTFPAGFVDMVRDDLAREGVQVQVVRKPLPAPMGPENPKVDSFPEDSRYDYQPETVRRLLKYGRMIAQVATGGGKCLGRDTPVMMFDGTIKRVQDVVVGDLLMGPDSRPRTVLSTTAGIGPLYRVTPTKGDAYVVNDAHILSLKKTSRGYRGRDRKGEKYPKGEIVNINVEDYLAETKTFRHIHKGWRTGVDFATGVDLPVDPYLLGVILGDGTINGTISVTTADDEIRSMLEEQAAVWGLTCNVIPKEGNAASAVYLTAERSGGRLNPLMSALRSLGFICEGRMAASKFIPHAYKTASRADRLALLAGILDTDGHYDGKCMHLTLKDERLFDDCLFLVRSLGFAAYKSVRQKRCHNNGVTGTYFSMSINGNLDAIPVRLPRRKANPRTQKKDPLVTGLSVEPIGEGEYFGFEIDGDRLFLLGDFTVTHNTRIARLAFARIRRPTLFLTTRSVLMYQMKDAFEESFNLRAGVLGDSEWTPRKGFNVGMVQTLAARIAPFDYAAELQALREKQTKEHAKALRDGRTYTPAKIEDLQRRVQAKMEAHNERRRKTLKLLEYFEFVILEEAHEAGGNSYYEVLQRCKNAHYRLALTGTPFMRGDEEANMRLMAAAGQIGIKISEKMLIERGILATPYFKFVSLPKPDKLYRTTPWQRAYKFGIVENEARNRSIVNHVREAVAYGLPVMILVQHKAHGKVLKDMIKAAGIGQVDFIFGEHKQDARKRSLGKLADGRLKVLIGSTILDVGVDVPAVGLVILAGGGKAEVALRQRIGRGLRAKKSGPNVAFILDFTDEHNTHLRDHAATRMAIIEGTPGFAENVLAPGVEFDYRGLGFKRVA